MGGYRLQVGLQDQDKQVSPNDLQKQRQLHRGPS